MQRMSSRPHRLAPVACAVACAVAASARGARANGRFPQANQLVVDPRDPAHLMVRSTYGLLQTFDAGGSFSWVCEAAVGFGGQEDPAIAVTGGGTLLAAMSEGLATSRDRGCGWGLAAGVLAGQFLVDVAVERAQPSRAVVVTTTGLGGGAFRSLVAETLDDGATWAMAGAPLPDDLIALTVDVAPSDPQHLYVSAMLAAARTPVLERSRDRGATWERVALDAAGAASVYIAAVDPADAKRLYLRADGDPSDTLFVSDDEGTTLRVLHATSGDMLGFALSPDGASLALGGPTDGVWSGPSSGPLAQASAVGAYCLTWADAGLYACAREALSGFTVGRSPDRGATFEVLAHLADVCPLACASTTTAGGACPAYWSTLADTLGQAPGACGASHADGGASAAPGADAPGDASCGCRVPGGPAPSSAGLAAAALLGVARLRRRRRRYSFGPSL